MSALPQKTMTSERKLSSQLVAMLISVLALETLKEDLRREKMLFLSLEKILILKESLLEVLLTIMLISQTKWPP